MLVFIKLALLAFGLFCLFFPRALYAINRSSMRASGVVMQDEPPEGRLVRLRLSGVVIVAASFIFMFWM